MVNDSDLETSEMDTVNCCAPLAVTEADILSPGVTVMLCVTEPCFDGDKFKGKGAAEFGGEKREWDIEGKREKKDK